LISQIAVEQLHQRTRKLAMIIVFEDDQSVTVLLDGGPAERGELGCFFLCPLLKPNHNLTELISLAGEFAVL